MDIFPQSGKVRPSSVDACVDLCDTPRMSRTSRKFLAVLMLLWLPVFTGSTLASSVSMQLAQSKCHGAAAPQMAGMSMNGNHHMDQCNSPAPNHNGCGVCQLACSDYVGITGVTVPQPPMTAREITPYVLAYTSISIVPLLPPPLARA
jgi:Protein of unknown function (DUF2946)